MATKTVINCMDHTILPPTQGISIIIEQQPDNLKPQAGFEYSNHSPNIIKIQHSSSSSLEDSSQQLLTLSSSTTLLNNNKTLIDINRNNDHMVKDPFNDHVLQINCTTSNEISKEINTLKENSNIKLESNGLAEMAIQNGNENELNNHLEHNEQENVVRKEIVSKEEETEFTKYKQYNFNSPEDEEESGQTTSQQQKLQQQHLQQQQVNNGNSKYRENGQNSSTKYEHNQHDIQQYNHDDDNNDDHLHNEVASIGDDHDNVDDHDDISANTTKRVVVDFSHGKRSFNEENSNSLITKADATTTLSTTTLTINELIENHSNNNNTNNDNNLENLKENLNHVVKIQIKPKDLKTEKQITVVKIENIQKPLENQDKELPVASENLENIANFPNLEIQQESVKINDKMVQKPSNNNAQTVTVSNNTHSSSATGNATVSNTGSTTVTELNVSNPNYLYYMMSSGQFSPCDTLDSGTGSDLESNGQQQHHQQSSPNILTKKSNNTSIKPLEMHIKTTKIRVTNSSKSKDSQQRQCSFTDSEESEASSLSCDSLHSNEFLRQQSTSPMETQSSSKKTIQSFLPDSLLREIKNLKFSTNDYEAENEEEDDILPQLNKSISTNYESDNNYELINTQDYQQAQTDYVKTRNNINNSSSSISSSLKRASLPSKTFVLNQEDGTFIDTKMNSMPRKYEADKYYNFHVNEHDNFRSFGNNSSSSLSNGDGDSFSLSDYDTKSLQDDVFAGYKDIRCGSNTSTIRSSKGTVRGVKNRVRNGIATFLQLQQPNVKNFKEKDSGKVVLYTTSMGIIRDTYAKCSNVKQILRTLLVKFEERDVFMSVEYQQEIKERMHSEIIKVPQLYVEGQHIGDADTVERLNESGELRQLLKPYKSISTTYTCQTCGGYRLLPCPSCNGSKKSVHRNHFTAEFVALKCMNCDEVGLVKCHNC